MNNEIVKILRDIQNLNYNLETAKRKIELLDNIQKEDSCIKLKNKNGAGIEILLGKEETRIVINALESYLLTAVDIKENNMMHLLRKIQNMNI